MKNFILAFILFLYPVTLHAGFLNDTDAFHIAKAVKLGRGRSASSGAIVSLKSAGATATLLKTCSTGQEYDATNKTCKKCDAGYYSPDGKACKKCETANGTCTTCTADTGKCLTVSCDYGYRSYSEYSASSYAFPLKTADGGSQTYPGCVPCRITNGHCKSCNIQESEYCKSDLVCDDGYKVVSRGSISKCYPKISGGYCVGGEARTNPDLQEGAQEICIGKTKGEGDAVCDDGYFEHRAPGYQFCNKTACVGEYIKHVDPGKDEDYFCNIGATCLSGYVKHINTDGTYYCAVLNNGDCINGFIYHMDPGADNFCTQSQNCQEGYVKHINTDGTYYCSTLNNGDCINGFILHMRPGDDFCTQSQNCQEGYAKQINTDGTYFCNLLHDGEYCVSGYTKHAAPVSSASFCTQSSICSESFGKVIDENGNSYCGYCSAFDSKRVKDKNGVFWCGVPLQASATDSKQTGYCIGYPRTINTTGGAQACNSGQVICNYGRKEKTLPNGTVNCNG